MDGFLFFIGFFAGAGVTGICVGAYLDHSEFKKEERKQYCISQFEGFKKLAIFKEQCRNNEYILSPKLESGAGKVYAKQENGIWKINYK